MTFQEARESIQTTLAAVDLYHGSVDGIFGPQTSDAFDFLGRKTDVAATGSQASPAVAPETGTGSAKAEGDFMEKMAGSSASGSLMVNGCYTGIADLHHGSTLDLGKFMRAGFGAIIHKASEGSGFRDPLYAARKSAAMSAGLLWGAYHFAAFADGAEQAKHFLSVENGKDPRVLLCLDFEPSSAGGKNMTIAQAEEFLTTVHAATGRWPMVYGGGGLLRDLLEGHRNDVFANCPLWLCDFEQHPRTILPIWPKWALLQYAGDGEGQEPRDVPGCDGADRNSFAGTLDELRALWVGAGSVGAAAKA